MSLKQNKLALFARNYSFKQKSNEKRNFYEKDSKMASSQRQTTYDFYQKQQQSAVRQLLQINDQQNQDWHDRTYKNDSSRKKKKNQIIFDKIQKKSGFFKDTVLMQQNQQNAQQIWIDSGLQNIFVKKKSFDHLNHQTQKKVQNKKTQDSQVSNHSIKKRQNLFQTNSYFMSRTNYWKNLSKIEISKDLSLNQKFSKNLTTQEIHIKSPQITESKVLIRADSFFDFYRSKSSFEKDNSSVIFEKIFDSKSQHKSIIILPNKSITVRQMLQKIKINQQIDLSNVSNTPQKKSRNHRFRSNRQPFQSSYKKNQQHKKFTPFRIEEQKKIQYSLQKLQQQIQKNPQLNERLHEIELKYFQKPSYCSWVERNKQKVRGKKNYPLTVRPLRLIN